MGVLDPIEDFLDGNEEDPMPDLALEYQACKQAVVDARLAWADAERTWAVSVTVAQPKGDPTLADAMQATYDSMQFAKCCVIAAGEAFKGETFEAVMARHDEGSG